MDNGIDSQKRQLKNKEDKKTKSNKNFENEDLYKDKTKRDDTLRIKDIIKIYLEMEENLLIMLV